MADTHIEWTDKVWNCIRGCSLVSEGCRNCYAMRQAHRFSGEGQPYHGLTVLSPTGPKWNGDIALIPDLLGEPMRWRKPCRVFVNSMSDVFHEGVDDYFINRIFAVMMLCPQHTFQILTKRPKRMMEYMNAPGRAGSVMLQAEREAFDQDTLVARHGRLPKTAKYDGTADITLGESLIKIQGGKWPPPNVWLGTSVENQKAFEERVQYLTATMAAVRWLSCEPLLGPIDMNITVSPTGWTATAYALSRINWVVVGGESGPGARPVHPEWVRSIRDQVKARGIAFFWKQWGDWLPVATPRMKVKVADSLLLASDGTTKKASWSDVMNSHGDLWGVQRVGKKLAGRLLDGREWNEYPQ